MLHRLLAALLCVLGLVAIGLAVASATVWRAPDALSATATAEGGHTLLLTGPGVLDMGADEVTVVAEADGGPVVLALGRTVDVEAWAAPDPHTRVTGLVDERTLLTEPVAAQPGSGDSGEGADTGEGAEGGDGAQAGEGSEEGAEPSDEPEQPADPSGSDLWVEEVTDDTRAELRWQAEPGRWSVLVAGTQAGTVPTLTLTWPQEVTTPWLVPGLVVGTLLLLAGLAWLAYLLLADRRSSGHAPAAVGAGASADGAPPRTRREIREAQLRGSAADREAVRRTFPIRIAGPQRDGASVAPVPEQTVPLAAEPSGRPSAEPSGRPSAEPDGPPTTESSERPTTQRSAPPSGATGATAAQAADAGTEQGRPADAPSGDAWRRAWGLRSTGQGESRDVTQPSTDESDEPEEQR